MSSAENRQDRWKRRSLPHPGRRHKLEKFKADRATKENLGTKLVRRESNSLEEEESCKTLAVRS